MKKSLLVLLMCLIAIAFINTKDVSATKSKFIIEDEYSDKVLVKYKGNKSVVRVPTGVTRIEGGAFKRIHNTERDTERREKQNICRENRGSF